MANQSFQQLIQSIAGAVAEAQDKIQRLQMSTVRQYFDADNRPVCIDVRLPAMTSVEGEERLVRVPLLSLVGARLLAVKDMEISFQVGLNVQTHTAPCDSTSAPNDEQGWPKEFHKPLNVDLGVRRNGGGGPLANVTLRVETQPPSDGMARLVQNLDKLI